MKTTKLMKSENEKKALEKQNQLNEQASGRTYCSKIRANYQEHAFCLFWDWYERNWPLGSRY